MQRIRTGALLVSLVMLALSGCSDSGSSSSSTTTTQTTSVGGAGTKGPLVDAAVTVFQLDDQVDDLRGAQLATGSTNAQAAIQVALANDTEGLLLVEVRATEETTDLTTGEAPVLTRLTTVIDAQDWLAGQAVYATPLTHLAVEIAARNVGTNVESALARAQRAVRNTFGFGLLDDDGFDIFTTPPLLTSGIADDESRQRVLRHRRAVEGVAAVLAELAGDPDGTEALFDLVAQDLASGAIDATDKDGLSIDYGIADFVANLEASDPDTLPIPKHPLGRTVAQVREDLNEERETIGVDEASGPEVTDDDDTDVGATGSPTTDSGLATLEGEDVEITVDVSPEGGGAVSGAGVAGADTTVALEATAAEHYSFSHWEIPGEDDVVENPYSFVADADLTLVAVFEADTFDVSVTVDPALGGTVTGDGAVPFNSTADLEAITADGFAFVAWEDEEQTLLSEEAAYSFVMPAEDVTLVVRFELTSAEVEGGEGSISIDAPNGHVFGQEVTYTAVPAPGFQFVNWVDSQGAQLTTEAAYTFTLDESSDIRAVFEEDPDGDGEAVWDQFNWDEANWQ